MSKIYLADSDNFDNKIEELLNRFQSKITACPPGTCPLTVQLSLLQTSAAQTCAASPGANAVSGDRFTSTSLLNIHRCPVRRVC